MSSALVPTKHPKVLARLKDATQRQLRRRSIALNGGIVAAWLATSVTIGLGMSEGALVHFGWLAIMLAAVLSSPVALIALRRVNIAVKAARLALAEAEVERDAPDHLHGALARFYAETRVIRVGLSDAVEPGEGVRMLWEWRRGFESLSLADREQLDDLGVGIGPIVALLTSVESEGALSDEQRHDAAAHLGHLESLLAEPRGGVYR